MAHETYRVSSEEDVSESISIPRNMFVTDGVERVSTISALTDQDIDEYGAPITAAPTINIKDLERLETAPLTDAQRAMRDIRRDLDATIRHRSTAQEKAASVIKINSDQINTEVGEIDWPTTQNLDLTIGNMQLSMPVAESTGDNIPRRTLLETYLSESKREKGITKVIGPSLVRRRRKPRKPALLPIKTIKGFSIGNYVEAPYISYAYEDVVIIGSIKNIIKFFNTEKKVPLDVKRSSIINMVLNESHAKELISNIHQEELKKLLGFEISIGTSIGKFTGIRNADDSQISLVQDFFVGDRVNVGILIEGVIKGAVIALGEESMTIGCADGLFDVVYSSKIKKIDRPRPVKEKDNGQPLLKDLLQGPVSEPARGMFRNKLRTVLEPLLGIEKENDEEKKEIFVPLSRQLQLTWDDYIEKEYRLYRINILRNNADANITDEAELHRRATEINGDALQKEVDEINNVIEGGALGKEDREEIKRKIGEFDKELEPMRKVRQQRENLLENYKRELERLKVQITEEADEKGVNRQLAISDNGFYLAEWKKIQDLERVFRNEDKLEEKLQKLKATLRSNKMSENHRRWLVNRRDDLKNQLLQLKTKVLIDSVCSSYNLTVERNYIDENNKLWKGLLEQLRENHDKSPFEQYLQIALEEKQYTQPERLITLSENDDSRDIPMPITPAQRAEVIVAYIMDKFGPLSSDRSITGTSGEEQALILEGKDYEIGEAIRIDGLFEVFQDTQNRNNIENALLEILRQRNMEDAPTIRGRVFRTWLYNASFRNHELATEDVIKRGRKILNEQKAAQNNRTESVNEFLERQARNLNGTINQIARDYVYSHPRTTESIYVYLRDAEIKAFIDANIPDDTEYIRERDAIRSARNLRQKRKISKKAYIKAVNRWTRVQKDYNRKLKGLKWNQGKKIFLERFKDQLLDIYLKFVIDFFHREKCPYEEFLVILNSGSLEKKEEFARSAHEIECITEKDVKSEEDKDIRDELIRHIDEKVRSYEQALYNRYHGSIRNYLTQGLLLSLCLGDTGLGTKARMFKAKIQSGMYELEGTIDADLTYFLPENTAIVSLAELTEEIEKKYTKCRKADKEREKSGLSKLEAATVQAAYERKTTELNELLARLQKTAPAFAFSLIIDLDTEILFGDDENIVKDIVNELKSHFLSSVALGIYIVGGEVSREMMDFSEELWYLQNPGARRRTYVSFASLPSLMEVIPVENLCDREVALRELVLCKDSKSSKFHCYTKDEIIESLDENKFNLPQSTLKKMRDRYISSA